MKVIFVVLSAVAFVRGGNIGYPSSYNSVSGSQYHPQGWTDNSASSGWSDRSSNAGWSSSSVSAGWSPSYSSGHIQKSIYPEHIPVIKDGVPTETPEVQAAKAHFYAEYHRAASLAAQKPDPLDGQYAEEYKAGKYLPVGSGWTGAENRVSHVQPAAAWEVNSEFSNNLEYNHNNYVPEDTPEVQAAKAAHFQAYATALARANSHQHQKQYHRYRRSASEWAQPKYQGPIHVPHITEKGVPADTIEVQKARLIHHQALNDAAARAHAAGDGEEHTAWNSDEGHGQQAYGPPQSAGWPSAPTKVAYQIHHDEAHVQKWNGPEHIPVLDHNGVPVDTPEVQHARKAHLAALAAESLKHKGWEGVQQKW